MFQIQGTANRRYEKMKESQCGWAMSEDQIERQCKVFFFSSFLSCKTL